MPDPFDGLWIDANGRAMRIRHSEESGYTVTITEAVDGRLYWGSGGRTRDMQAKRDDTEEGAVLVVEAGTAGLGPTVQFLRLKDRLYPHVRSGLYDDWEMDCGVPWMFPLSPWRPAWDAEEADWGVAAPMRDGLFASSVRANTTGQDLDDTWLEVEGFIVDLTDDTLTLIQEGRTGDPLQIPRELVGHDPMLENKAVSTSNSTVFVRRSVAVKYGLIGTG